MSTGILASIRRRYLAERVTLTPNPEQPKKQLVKWLVMFNDQSGNFFLLDSVPPELQFPDKRKTYMKEHDIKPSAQLTVIEGFLEAINHTADPTVLDQACSFLEDANNGLGVPYLLAHKFVTENHMLGLTAGAVATKELCTEEEAIKAAPIVWQKLVGDHKRKAGDQLGLSGNYMPRFADPSDKQPKPENVPDASGKETQVIDQAEAERLLKVTRIGEAKALGIKANKSWSIERIDKAIAKKKDDNAKIAAAQAEAAAAEAASVEVADQAVEPVKSADPDSKF